MSTSTSSETAPPADTPPPVPPHDRGMSRRGWTIVISVVIVVALGLIGGFVPVPYVALGPGPTYDTLSTVNGTEIVHLDGIASDKVSGQLRMTTVSLSDDMTLFGALGYWLSGRYALAPREDYIKPGETKEQVEKENVKQFQDSQTAAEVAALRYLDKPIKVIAKEIGNGTPADHVLAPGDRLLVVNGKKVNNAEDVRAALVGTHPGQTIDLTFNHDGQDTTKQITLGSSPDRKEGLIGVTPADRADVPFKITIHLQDVGGPSAGLMFALAIVDRLTPGELSNDKVVAGTGEIDSKGNVGPIGGISFKMVAAKDAGASVFLVPADNCAEAKTHVPDGLQLVKVDSLTSAVHSLEGLKTGQPAPSC